MANYLVTGAAGFIGSSLAKVLVREGHRVVTIDNLSTGFAEAVPEGVEFFQANCQDSEIYEKIPQIKYDAIFHIAGQSSGEISFDDPSYDLRTNAESTLHLLKFALQVSCARFVYASSMSVYGEKPDRPIREDELVRPISFYGVGKLTSEHYLRLYEQYGIRSTSLRLFNVYGPGQNLLNWRQGMVSIFLSQMLKNGHIHVKGSGERYRDFVYIDDVVGAFLSCLSCPESEGKVINIGTGVRTKVDQLVKKMIALSDVSVTTEFIGSTPGDMHGIYADIGLSERVLGFKPKYELSKGLIEMVGWAKSVKEEGI